MSESMKQRCFVLVLKFPGESVLPGARSSKWQCGPAACGAGDGSLCSLPSEAVIEKEADKPWARLSDVTLLFGDRT